MQELLLKLTLRTGITEQDIKEGINELTNPDLILAVSRGQKFTDAELAPEFYEICDSEHSSCNNACPVYRLNGGEAPGSEKYFKENRGCDCFKNGTAMLKFIRKKLK